MQIFDWEISVMLVNSLNSVQEINVWFPSTTYSYDSGAQILSHSSLNCIVVAQVIKDPDLLGTWNKSFDNFIESGQVWALLIGLVVGYLIRGLTTYG